MQWVAIAIVIPKNFNDDCDHKQQRQNEKKSFSGHKLCICQLTVCVSRWWAGWDSAGEQGKLEARKMPVSRDESHQSAARFVGTLFILQQVRRNIS
jgi:hypothetical protein